MHTPENDPLLDLFDLDLDPFLVILYLICSFLSDRILEAIVPPFLWPVAIIATFVLLPNSATNEINSSGLW